MYTRRVLALAGLLALALLAGCSSPGGLEMTPATDDALADAASRPVDVGPPVPEESNRTPAAVARTAIENGSATVTGTAPPLETDLAVEHRGAYYALDRRVVATGTQTVVDLEIDYNATDPTGTTLAYADLPRADRDALDGLLPQRLPDRVEGMDLGIGAFYTDAELADSVLVNATDPVVVYEGERYPVRVSDPRPVTVTTYRYEASLLAPNASAFADHLRAEYAFTLGGLPDPAREVLDAAVAEGSYDATSPDDEGFQAVVDAFRAHEAITRDETSGVWVVRYEGETYVADLRYGGFTEE